MIKGYDKILLKTSRVFEYLLSLIISIIVFLGTIDLVRSIYNAYIVDFENLVDYSELNTFLAQILLLVIGVELIAMLCLHKSGVLLEVLLYAIARKLILLPKTLGMDDLFLGVIAIGIIFIIRNYLLNSEERNISLSKLYNSKLIELKKHRNKKRKASINL